MEVPVKGRPRGQRLLQGVPSTSASIPPVCENGQELYECPMCRLVCAKYQILQEHVELHLEECNFLETNFSDLELAQQLQQEEDRKRREITARQEREEFQKLQRQYGLDGSGGYKQQSLKNLEKEVAWGRMQPSEYHKRKADMMESLAFGIDDGKTQTSAEKVPPIELEHFETEGEDFLKKIITGDETWVHHYDPKNKRHSMEYRHKKSAEKKFKNQDSARKVMLTVFWNSEHVVLSDFLEKGTTMSSERYIETLTALKRRIKRIGIRNETLQHDNARPHTSAATRDAIQRLNFSVLLHPPYSPDLAPSGFHQFPKLKEHLKS